MNQPKLEVISMTVKRCPSCGREIKPKNDGKAGRKPTYCSHACRQKAYEARSKGDPITEPSVPLPHHVTEEDLAGAVVQARGAQATFTAGARIAAPQLRPLCGRIAEGIRETLDREGL